MGSDEATAALHGTHNEIFRLARHVPRARRGRSPPRGPEPDDWPDLRRVLYGLDAILRLHQAQEEELYASVSDKAPASEPVTVSPRAPGAPAG